MDSVKQRQRILEGKSSSLVTLFLGLANEREHQANELQEIVVHNSEGPKVSGSVAAAAHRAWMDIRSALGGGEHAIL